MGNLREISKLDLSFENKVTHCRTVESSEMIQNAAWAHAVFLFKNLLQVASEKKESVRLITGHLNDEFYSELSEEIDNCIAAKVSVELIVLASEEELSGNGFYNKMKGSDSVNVLTVPEGIIINAPHMLLIGDDGRRFRLETDHGQTKAVASFNNKSMGDSLVLIYNDVKNRLSDRVVGQEKQAAPA